MCIDENELKNELKKEEKDTGIRRNMKSGANWKKVAASVSLVPVSIIIATIIMILLYSLPTQTMKDNIIKSTAMYDGGKYSFGNWANGKRYTELSNYTDTLMLNAAVFRPKESAVENAMLNANADFSEPEYYRNLLRIAKGEEGYTIQEYSRYWHGYLLYMIPALQVMNVGELKVVGMIVQFFLSAALIYLLGKRSKILMALYGIVALFINPVTTVLTFQDADIYCIMMISMIVVLRYHEKLKQGWYFPFFILNGICVAFFDFLTYPLVALGVPLVLVLSLDKSDIKDGLKKIVGYGFAWCIGYLGMWGGKWIVGSILTGRNLFTDAFGAVEFRTHGEYNGMVTYGNTLQTIWESINDVPMKALLLLAVGIIVFFLITRKYKVNINILSIRRCQVFFMIGLFPFAWYFVAMNHSVIHPWMSYRELAITIWAIAAIINELLTPQQRKQLERNDLG